MKLIKRVNKNEIFKSNCNFNKNFYKFPEKRFSNILEILTLKLTLLFGPKIPKFSILPSFDKLSDKEINIHTGINPKWTYRNSIVWTPRFYIQKDISQEFLFQLKKFRKLDQWDDLHQIALTELVLTEAIRDTTYEMALNYKVTPTNINPFHGLIDILLYNNDPESNFYPVVPIIFPRYEKEEGQYYERYSNAQIIGIAHCLLNNFKMNYAKNDSNDITFIRAIQTNGHDWCLLEIHDHYVKKTNFFRPSMMNPPPDYTPKLFDDYNHIRSIIGLIRYALNIEDNMVLKTSIYSLGQKSEEKLIEHKEAISSLKSDHPDLIEDIGLDKKLLDQTKKEDTKFIK